MNVRMAIILFVFPLFMYMASTIINITCLLGEGVLF